MLGAGIGLVARPSQRVIALVMGFGAGVLISALAFELTEEAFRRGGAGAQAGGSATAIVIGAVMDGIPESAAIGLTCSRAETWA